MQWGNVIAVGFGCGPGANLEEWVLVVALGKPRFWIQLWGKVISVRLFVCSRGRDTDYSGMSPALSLRAMYSVPLPSNSMRGTSMRLAALVQVKESPTDPSRDQGPSHPTLS